MDFYKGIHYFFSTFINPIQFCCKIECLLSFILKSENWGVQSYLSSIQLNFLIMFNLLSISKLRIQYMFGKTAFMSLILPIFASDSTGEQSLNAGSRQSR